MNRSQTANMADFDVALKPTETVLLKGKIRTDVRFGSKLQFRFHADVAGVFTVQTSTDGSTWADLGADVTVVAGTFQDATRTPEVGEDVWVRVTGVASTTPGQGRIQLRDAEGIELREMNQNSAL